MADAADAVAEVTPEAAAEATPVVEVPAAETAPAAEATPAEGAASAAELAWIEEFGGAAAVKEAAEFRQSLKTEDGAIDAFVEFGVALGLTPAQLASLFPEEAAAAAAADAEQAEENDKPMTRAEIEQLLNDAVITPLQQQQEQAQVADMRTFITTDLDTREIPEEARNQVLGFADNHLDEGDRFDKTKIAAAIVQGVADYEKWIDAQVEARIAKKAAINEAIPTPVAGGSTGGGEATAEPMTLAEAKARVRAQHGGK